MLRLHIAVHIGYLDLALRMHTDSRDLGSAPVSRHTGRAFDGKSSSTRLPSPDSAGGSAHAFHAQQSL